MDFCEVNTSGLKYILKEIIEIEHMINGIHDDAAVYYIVMPDTLKAENIDLTTWRGLKSFSKLHEGLNRYFHVWK